MKFRIFGLGIVAVAAFAAPAHAQNYPWCVVSSAYEGGQNCSFTTLDQCMATRQGIGGFCVENTQYHAAVSARPRLHNH